MIFLIEYDRRNSKLEEIISFSDDKRIDAEEQRLELELSNLKHGIDREVVILDAHSEKDLRKTHRRYFESISQLIENFKTAICDA